MRLASLPFSYGDSNSNSRQEPGQAKKRRDMAARWLRCVGSEPFTEGQKSTDAAATTEQVQHATKEQKHNINSMVSVIRSKSIVAASSVRYRFPLLRARSEPLCTIQSCQITRGTRRAADLQTRGIEMTFARPVMTFEIDDVDGLKFQ